MCINDHHSFYLRAGAHLFRNIVQLTAELTFILLSTWFAAVSRCQHNKPQIILFPSIYILTCGFLFCHMS